MDVARTVLVQNPLKRFRCDLCGLLREKNSFTRSTQRSERKTEETGEQAEYRKRAEISPDRKPFFSQPRIMNA